MIKRLIYTVLLSLLLSCSGEGQNNFFWSHHSNSERVEMFGHYRFCSYNFFGNGGCVDITDISLIDVEGEIVTYCDDEKTYDRDSYFITFYTDYNGVAIGDPIYQSEYGSALYENDITVILDMSGIISPCGLNGKYVIRIVDGYIDGITIIYT